MPTADTPPAISRLDLDGLGELRLQIRRAVHDLRLRAELSRNEVLLSFAVREFIVLDGPKDPPVRQQDAAPKVIVQYWHDGNDIPEDVARCMRTWQRFASEGFTFQVFDNRSALQFLEGHSRPAKYMSQITQVQEVHYL